MGEWLPWVMMPSLGALIGYGTNWLAIEMLFRPRQRVLGIQGLLPSRQDDLARAVGEVVASELVHTDKLLEPLKQVDLKPQVVELIDRVLAAKLDDLRRIPLVGAMLGDAALAGLKRGIVDELDKHLPALRDRVLSDMASRLDVAGITSDAVRGFDLDRLEHAVRKVAGTELRAITWWGALLGALVGVMQALVLWLVGSG